MITVLEKHGEDDYSVWFSEIPENDPLWKELMEKYKFKIGRPSEINMDDYDVVVSCNNVGYAHVKYTVLKNAPNLTDREIALLCDGGNLCFGYRVEGNTICVYTD